ncbi:MAG TPA: transposase family protein [Tepidisphaeraceae bacterium]|jgi:transposase InsO family protein|nr:transposase family protein [Tepidisphaeraceae bacterium]
MSAIPSILPQTTARAWWSIDEAAKIAGLSKGHVARECRQWAIDAGAAKFDRENGIGQAKLFVSAAFHPRLRIASNPDRFKPSDLSGYSLDQQNDARHRALLVDRLRSSRISAAASTRMDRIKTMIVEQAHAEFPELSVSVGSLERWDKIYQCPSDLERLIDRRGGDQRSQGHPEVWKYFAGHFCTGIAPSIWDSWDAANRFAAESNLDWCSYDSCRRQLNDRIPPAVQARHRSPKAYRNGIAPWIEQDPEKYAAGLCWHADWKLLDVICIHQGKIVRPWCCCWLDNRTRKITGHFLSASPDSNGIRRALVAALKDESNLGGPDRVHLDHGKDYESFTFIGATKQQRRAKGKDPSDQKNEDGLYNLLGIGASFAQPYNPQGKARLERFFRNLEPFCKAFPTYTGRDTYTKPETLAEILKTPDLIPTFETVSDRLANFIAGYNASADHQIDDLLDGGERLSPAAAYAKWCPRVKRMADPDALEMAARHWFPPCFVGRNGISRKIEGRTIRFGAFEPSLIEFKGRLKKDRTPVRVSIDPDKPSVIYVHRMNYKFVCRATSNNAAFDREGLRQSSREKRAYDRSVRITREFEYTDLLTPEEHARDAGIRNRHAVQHQDEPPRPIRIQSTPLDGQGRHVQRAALRLAVGAESLSPADAQRPSMLDSLRKNLTPRPRPEPVGVRSVMDSFEVLRHEH